MTDDDIRKMHRALLSIYDDLFRVCEKYFLKMIAGGGTSLGIITDGRSEGQRNKLEALGLKHMVDDIIITDELGGLQFRKPCDIAFRIMLNRWRLNPENVVYVGDNPVKYFQAPKQFGMMSVMVQNADGIYSSKDKCNQKIISSLCELVSVILGKEEDTDE